MPNLMVALPKIGGALCSTPQSLADARYYMPCSNAAKTQNPLKFVGVPQTPEPMVPRWRFLATFLRPVFAASRVQRISDLHSLIRIKATPCAKVW